MPRFAGLDGPVQRAAALRLGGDEPGKPVDEPDGVEVLQALPEPCDGAAVAYGNGDVIGDLPVKLLHDLQPDGLLALGEVGVDGGVAVVPAPLLDGLFAQLEGLFIAALYGNDGGSKGHQLGDLPLGGSAGYENICLHPCCRGVARQRGGGVSGGGAGDDLCTCFRCFGDSHGAGTVFEGGGRVYAVVLHVQMGDAQLFRQPSGLVERAPAHPQGRRGGGLLYGEQLPVAPHGVVTAGG